MDEEGNLVGVKETVDFDSREVANTETTNIRNELLRSTALNEKASE